MLNNNIVTKVAELISLKMIFLIFLLEIGNINIVYVLNSG